MSDKQKFAGTIDQLKAHVTNTQIGGKWSESNGAHRFKSNDGGNLSWWVGGWSSFDPAQVRSATIFFFTPVLEPQATHLHGGKGQDLARLPNDDILYIADVDIADEDRHDFELCALTTPLGEPLWSQVFTGATSTRGRGLTVTPHGHIAVLGTSTTADMSELSLVSFHP